MNELVQTELKKIFNGRFSTSESTRANYARGEDTYEPVLSQAVVFPETNEEVSKSLMEDFQLLNPQELIMQEERILMSQYYLKQ